MLRKRNDRLASDNKDQTLCLQKGRRYEEIWRGEDSLLSVNESLAVTLQSDCIFVSFPSFNRPAR